MGELTDNLSEETENTKQGPSERKNTVSEMKNAPEGINSMRNRPVIRKAGRREALKLNSREKKEC